MDPSSENDRVIALIDMDCFYAQVEQKDRPESIGKPLATIQYNNNRRGMILSANYEARARGIKTGTRSDEALAKCPELILAAAPTQRGKTDLTKYRNASKQVFNVLFDFGESYAIVVERASIDEAFLDLTPAVRRILDSASGSAVVRGDLATSHVVMDVETTIEKDDGDDGEDTLDRWLREIRSGKRDMRDLRLAVGARLVEDVRSRILNEAGYHCSAGIAENKMLAKLVCKMHKPKRQTIIPRDSVSYLFESTPICDVRNLGGKFGANVCERFGIETMSQVAKIPLETLKTAYKEKTALWLHQLSLGIDSDDVILRQLVKSIGCSKNFQGKAALKTKDAVDHWVKILCEELEERLKIDQAAYHRTARGLCVSIKLGQALNSVSRHCPLPSYDAVRIAKAVSRIISELNEEDPRESNAWKVQVTVMAISAGRFEDSVDIPDTSITDYFKPTVRNAEKNDQANIETGECSKAAIPASSTDFDNVDARPAISVIPKYYDVVDLEDADDRPGSPSSDIAIMDGGDTNSAEASRDVYKMTTDDEESNSASCGSKSPTGPINFEDAMSVSPSKAMRHDPDILAPTAEGALKRRKLADETTAALLANDRVRLEESSKDSFFLKRLLEKRKREEQERAAEGDEEDAEEAEKAEEENRRKKVQERMASAAKAARKAREPEPSTSSRLDDSKFVDAEPWLPSGQDDVDMETWKNLPPEIQWELRQHFRRCGTTETPPRPVTPASDSSGGSRPKSAKKSATKKQKATGRPKKNSSSTSGKDNGIRKLSEYFPRS